MLTSWCDKFEEGKMRIININSPPRPPFCVLKYLIVLGQLCCFVGRASVDPFYKNTPVSAQWRPCPVAPRTAQGTGVSKEFKIPPLHHHGAASGWQSQFRVLLERSVNHELRLNSLHLSQNTLSHQQLYWTPSFCIKLILYAQEWWQHCWRHNCESNKATFSRRGKGEPLILGWKTEMRNQFCRDVTWQLATKTGMTCQAVYFLDKPWHEVAL